MKGITLFRQICSLALLLVFFSPTSPWALDCSSTRDELVAALPGTWIAENSAGTLSFNGKTMALPPRNGGSGEILQSESGLSVMDWGVPGVFPATFVENARFVLAAPNAALIYDGAEFLAKMPDFVSSDELSLLLGCKEDDIPPQLHISGAFDDPEGKVDFDVFLFVLNENTLYGVTSGKLSAMNGHAKRITRWVRSQ
mgnify:FL=1